MNDFIFLVNTMPGNVSTEDDGMHPWDGFHNDKSEEAFNIIGSARNARDTAFEQEYVSW